MIRTSRERFNCYFPQKRLTFCKHDVRDKDNWSEVFTHCDTFFEGQPVELLINNAGVGAGPPYDTVVDINLKGVMHGTKAFLEKYGTSKVIAKIRQCSEGKHSSLMRVLFLPKSNL